SLDRLRTHSPLHRSSGKKPALTSCRFQARRSTWCIANWGCNSLPIGLRPCAKCAGLWVPEEDLRLWYGAAYTKALGLLCWRKRWSGTSVKRQQLSCVHHLGCPTLTSWPHLSATLVFRTLQFNSRLERFAFLRS